MTAGNEEKEWRPERIRNIREVLELSQAEFAEKVGVSRKTVVRWESGRAVPFPNLQLKLEELAKKAIGFEVPYYTPDEIRGIRGSRGWTQKEFAQIIGATQWDISRWEAGEYIPSTKYRIQLAHFLCKNVPSDNLTFEVNKSLCKNVPSKNLVSEVSKKSLDENVPSDNLTFEVNKSLCKNVPLFGKFTPENEQKSLCKNVPLHQNVPSKNLVSEVSKKSLDKNVPSKNLKSETDKSLCQDVPFNGLHYDTNRWGDYRWVMVQAYKQSDGDWSKRTRWKWWPVEKLELFRKQHDSTLIFNTIGHFQEQDKMSPQIENLCFDFDAKDSVEFELARLSVISISRYFWDFVPEEAIRYWFTGGRSFHIEIAYQVFGIEPQPELNLIMKHLAMYINQHLKEDDDPNLLVDESIYSNPRMWRMPNSFYPKYDAWKIELSYEEVFSKSEAGIREIAKEPRPPLYDLSQLNVEESALLSAFYEPIPEAVEWYKERLQEYHELKEERQHVPVNPRAFVSLSGIPDCIADLRQNTIKKAGLRNKATILDATFCLQTGVKLEDAQATINDWVQRIDDGLTGCKSGRERENATKSVVNYIYDNKEKYKFGCGYAKALGLACSEEDCPLYNAIAFQKWGKRVKVIENFQPNPPLQQVNSEGTDAWRFAGLTVSEARELYSEEIKNFIRIPNSEFRIPSARFYDMIQGTGKSVTGIMTLDELRRHTIYGAPRHDIISDLLPLTRNEMDWKHILPRGPVGEKPKGATEEEIKAWEATALCPFFKRANALAAKRWNVAKYLCAYDCPDCFASLATKPNCRWWGQFKHNGSSAIVHEYFFMPTIFEWLAKETNPVVVFDEPNPNTFIETVNVTATTLTTEMARNRSTDVRELLKIIRRAVEKFAVDDDKKRIMGKAVISAILSVTPPDLNLRDLIENSKSALCYPETSVEVTAETILNATDKAYLALVDGQECWIPKKFEAAIGPTSRFMVPVTFAEEKGIPYKDDFNPTAGEGVPLNFVEDLVACLQRDFEQYSAGKNYNSPLVITKYYGEPCLRMNLRKFFAVPASLPLLLMDGSGNAELLAELIKRPVEKWSIPMRPDVEVIQIVDGSYGITTLFKKKKGKDEKVVYTLERAVALPRLGEPRKSFYRLLKAAKQIAALDPESTVIITWKLIASVLKDLQAKGEIDSRIAIDHYGNVEGSNIYEEKRQVILFGTPCLQPEDLLELAHAIWTDDDNPLDAETIKDGNWRPYQYREEETGNGYAVEVREYKDRRLNLLLHTYREQELVQAAHRIRPILTPGKKIYLLTNIPLDELPPTKLATVRELIGNTDATFLLFKDTVKRIVEDYSGVWLKAAKTRFDTNVININIYYVDVKAGLPTERTLYRWFIKAVRQLELQEASITVTQSEKGHGNATLSVWHDSNLDEERIRGLYKNLND